jgi:hypothetical protein
VYFNKHLNAAPPGLRSGTTAEHFGTIARWTSAAAHGASGSEPCHLYNRAGRSPMKHHSITLVFLLMLLGGCATSSPITRYSESESAFNPGPEVMHHAYPDGDIYRIYHRAASGFVSIQSIRQAAEKRGLEFCQRQGRSMVVLGEKISQPPYILGNFPRIEIVFAAVEKAHEPQGHAADGDPYEKLTRLKKLLDDGALTQEEFNREKAKVLEPRGGALHDSSPSR